MAKTPSTHEHVQTHVPGILFRGGDVRNVLSLREGEERKREEEALERERDLNPRDRVLNTIYESANKDDIQREKRYFVILKQRRRRVMMMMTRDDELCGA